MRFSAKLLLTALLLSSLAFVNTAQQPPAAPNKLIIHADLGEHTISKHIYGHFSEHLGRCIYGGFWVGEDAEISNTNGVRTAVIDALKQIQIPNLRWPGGCFADEYHWMDGIGPRDQRPSMINTHWGGVTEDNSFGTHEFLNLCEEMGTEPYISANMGSGTVQEMSNWVEYVNSDAETPMTKLRRQNGRAEPWNVKFWGVGNENWGCGGNMTPEYYSDLYRRYATYCRDYGDNELYKIACGASDYDYNWTETVMKNVGRRMDAISLHYYTVLNWSNKGSATEFDESRFFETIAKARGIEEVLNRHITIMDRYDPNNRIGLIVDEWGTWHDVEPGTNPGFLYQQNTLRDAFVAGITLNIFNAHCDRVKMANLAQTINVLQALILTDDDQMLLTPTYHVFDMYKAHQDATLLPSDLTSEEYESGENSIPALNVSTSKSADGSINLSIVNVHPTKAMPLDCEIRGDEVSSVSGRMLTAEALNDYNTFDEPEKVVPGTFDDAQIENGMLTVEIPAKSIVVLKLQ